MATHVHGLVLQHLEAADRHAELLARAQKIDRHFVHRGHGADGFRGKRRDRLMHHPLDRRERLAGLADRGVGPNLHALKRHFRRPQAVHRLIAAA